jgi:putative ABC transport system permease protein
VWRDYVRQTGAITLDSADYQRLTGDTRISDLAWPADGGHGRTAKPPQRGAASQRGSASGHQRSGLATGWQPALGRIRPPIHPRTLAAHL